MWLEFIWDCMELIKLVQKLGYKPRDGICGRKVLSINIECSCACPAAGLEEGTGSRARLSLGEESSRFRSSSGKGLREWGKHPVSLASLAPQLGTQPAWLTRSPGRAVCEAALQAAAEEVVAVDTKLRADRAGVVEEAAGRLWEGLSSL